MAADDPNRPLTGPAPGSPAPGRAAAPAPESAPVPEPAAERFPPAGPPPAPPSAGPPLPPPGLLGVPGPAPGLEYATFGGRLIAYVIDVVIVGLVTGALAALSGVGLLGFYGLGAFGGFRGPFDLRSILDIGLGRILFAVLAAVISGVYFVYFWTHNGATPGQSFLALELRNAADGARLTQDQAIRRWALLTVPFVSLLPVVGLLVFAYQVFLAYTTFEDPAHQGFHDKEARSVVVRRVT